MRKPALRIALVLTVLMFSAPMVFAQNAADGDAKIKPGENSKEELAKAAQNPVADMISLPLQNNTNFGYGPGDDIQNVLNIQPVVPFQLNEYWNLRFQLQFLFPKGN